MADTDIGIVSDRDRRIDPRTDTAFLAVELRAARFYYRLVRNISASGFLFAWHVAPGPRSKRTSELDITPLSIEIEDAPRTGHSIVMEFPLPGSPSPIRVVGRVVYAHHERGVGVRIEEVERDRYAKLIAVPPPARL